MPKPAKCRSCQAAILWVKHDGRNIPMNVRRVRAYQIRDIGALEEAPFVFDFELAHISHFVTCPNASEHSKNKPRSKTEDQALSDDADREMGIDPNYRD
jgi:hypothetical protein